MRNLALMKNFTVDQDEHFFEDILSLVYAFPCYFFSAFGNPMT